MTRYIWLCGDFFKALVDLIKRRCGQNWNYSEIIFAKIEFWNIYNYFRRKFDENFNNTLLIRNVGLHS